MRAPLVFISLRVKPSIMTDVRFVAGTAILHHIRPF
jgi:hypothetical protein